MSRVLKSAVVELPGYRDKYPCQRLQVHHPDVENYARRIPRDVYVAVIGYLARGADYPVNVFYALGGDVRVHGAIEVLKCLGVLEEVGSPLDLTKPIATTPVALAVSVDKALEIVDKLFSITAEKV